MKNRFQFNRIPQLFESREAATDALVRKYKDDDFIHLIGEPIVVRYLDKNNQKQLMLAVGKATGSTIDDWDRREYHIIDTAELREDLNSNTETADRALELASAATKTIADYRVILQNMISDGGVELEDGSYFETDDPSGCGLYKVYPGTNFIVSATSLAKADYLLDQAIGNANGNLNTLSGAVSNLSASTIDNFGDIKTDLGTFALNYDSNAQDLILNWVVDGINRSSRVDVSDFVKDSFLEDVQVVVRDGVKYMQFRFRTYDGQPLPIYVPLTDLSIEYTVDPDSHTFMTINDYVVSLNVDEEDGLASYETTQYISAVTSNIIKAAGLTAPGEEGKYPGHSGVTCYYISAATSLDNADVILDNALWATSGLISDVSNRVDTLSGVVETFSAHTVEALSALSVSVDERIESGLTIISGVVENYVEEKLSGITGDLIDRIENELCGLTEDLSELSGVVIDNELVTAAALNDLNSRIKELSGNASNDIETLSGGVMANESAITIISGIIEDNELVTAAALNDLNRRILDNDEDIAEIIDGLNSVSAKTSGVLTINLNGVEQGKYSPSANTSINIEVIEEVTGEDVLLTNYVISSETDKDALEIKPTDNVNQAFGKIEKKVNDNELVTAAAINELNSRIIDLSGNTGDMYVDLDARIRNLSGGSADVSNCFDGAEYNSTDKKIYFKHGDVVKGEIDATAFIKDGMVDNVSINGGNLVITFNTDAGKENIVLALTDIFDPSNYYNKTEINVLSSATETVKNGLTALSGAVESLSASVVTNKTNIQSLSAATVTVSGNVSNLSGAVINLSAATVGLENNVDALSASVVTNKMNIATLSGDMLDNELVVAAALNDLNSRILELSGNSSDMSNYYTTANTYNKTEVNNLISGATQRKYTTASTLVNLALNEFLTIVKINGSTTLSIGNSLPTLPANGVAERHVIIENTGSTDAVVEIASDTRVKLTMNNKIAIDRAGGIGELNALITYDGSAYTIYVITT